MMVLAACLYSTGDGFGASWCWDPVELSCAGNPADVTSYVILVAWLDPNLYPCQVTECGPSCDPLEPDCCVDVPGWCIAYTLSAWSDADLIQAPVTCSSWDAATPPPGSVAMIQVVAENANGRGPTGPCP